MHYKIIAIFSVIFSWLIIEPVNASSIKFESLENGFTAFYEQTDPFDDKEKKYIYIMKNGFSFKCENISFSDRVGDFDSFSFSAEIALKVDDNTPINLTGTYSTYLWGSNLMTDSRVYSAHLTNDLLQQLKEGSTLKAAGKFNGVGWSSFSVSLLGFTRAYNTICHEGTNS